MYKFLCVISLIVLTFETCLAQTKALSDDPDYIKASMLIASPGYDAHQAFGHAFIRMECPEHEFDIIFSFGNDGDNELKMFLEGAKGKYYEFDTSFYLRQYEDEGRGVMAYPLNLTLDEKARLWEVLDSLKVLPQKPFDVVESHCFSEIARSLEIALYPSKINWDEPPLQSGTYGENAKKFLEDASPWNRIFITIPLADWVDKSGSGRKFVYPTIFSSIYRELEIVAPDGERRRLVDETPKVLVEKTKDELDRPISPTPMAVAMSILLLVVAVTGGQLWHGWSIAGKIVDGILWAIAIGGGIMLALITYMPGHAGGSWNWIFIVANPLGWLPFAVIRRSLWRRYVWVIYAGVLLLFTVGITVPAPSMNEVWRLLAMAIAIRCMWHACWSK